MKDGVLRRALERGIQKDLILINSHPHALRLSCYCIVLVALLLDVVDHEEELVLLLLLDVRRGQRGLGADRLEADKGKGAYQIWSVEAILADTQNDTVALQLLFGEFQQRDERVFRGLVGHGRRQVHVQHIVQGAEDRFPGAVLLRRDVELQCNLRW